MVTPLPPPIKTKNVKTGAHNRQSRNSPQPSLFTFLMVRSLILRIGYFFCVLCKSTTYHLIFAIVKDWSSCRRFFFVRRLRKSRSLATCAWRYKWNSTCRLQTSKNIIFSISVFDYSGAEVFAGFADLKRKNRNPPCPPRLIDSPSLVFSFFNLLDSCFWFHACFFLLCFLYESGWCMSCRPLKRTRKKKTGDNRNARENRTLWRDIM